MSTILEAPTRRPVSTIVPGGPFLKAPSARHLEQLLRIVPDHPRPGIQFIDIMPLLADPGALRSTIDALATPFEASPVDRVVAIESRGFLLGAGLAARLGAGLVALRKPGKLPGLTTRVSYALEYGEDALEVQQDALRPGDRVLLVDDVLATGGTAGAALKLIQELQGEVVGVAFLIELAELGGRARLGDVPLHVVLER